MESICFLGGTGSQLAIRDKHLRYISQPDTTGSINLRQTNNLAAPATAPVYFPFPLNHSLTKSFLTSYFNSDNVKWGLEVRSIFYQLFSKNIEKRLVFGIFRGTFV